MKRLVLLITLTSSAAFAQDLGQAQIQLQKACDAERTAIFQALGGAVKKHAAAFSQTLMSLRALYAKAPECKEAKTNIDPKSLELSASFSDYAAFIGSATQELN